MARHLPQIIAVCAAASFLGLGIYAAQPSDAPAPVLAAPIEPAPTPDPLPKPEGEPVEPVLDTDDLRPLDTSTPLDTDDLLLAEPLDTAPPTQPRDPSPQLVESIASTYDALLADLDRPVPIYTQGSPWSLFAIALCDRFIVVTPQPRVAARQPTPNRLGDALERLREDGARHPDPERQRLYSLALQLSEMSGSRADLIAHPSAQEAINLLLKLLDADDVAQSLDAAAATEPEGADDGEPSDAPAPDAPTDEQPEPPQPLSPQDAASTEKNPLISDDGPIREEDLLRHAPDGTKPVPEAPAKAEAANEPEPEPTAPPPPPPDPRLRSALIDELDALPVVPAQPPAPRRPDAERPSAPAPPRPAPPSP